MENRKLIRIQKDNNLNEVYAVDEPGIGNASHEYLILLPTDELDVAIPVEISFQNGPSQYCTDGTAKRVSRPQW